MGEWARSNWQTLLVFGGPILAALFRWGSTISRLLASPFTNSILRERLTEREAQVEDLAGIILGKDSRIASLESYVNLLESRIVTTKNTSRANTTKPNGE